MRPACGKDGTYRHIKTISMGLQQCSNACRRFSGFLSYFEEGQGDIMVWRGVAEGDDTRRRTPGFLGGRERVAK